MQTLTDQQIKSIQDRKTRLYNGICPRCKAKLKYWFSADNPWCVDCERIWTIEAGYLVENIGGYSKANYDSILREMAGEMGV